VTGVTPGIDFIGVRGVSLCLQFRSHGVRDLVFDWSYLCGELDHRFFNDGLGDVVFCGALR
jgi:hypothetical protein